MTSSQYSEPERKRNTNASSRRDRRKSGPTPKRNSPRAGRPADTERWEFALAVKWERDHVGEFRKNLAGTGGNAIKAGTSGARALHLDSLDTEIPDPPNRRARRILAHYGSQDI